MDLSKVLGDVYADSRAASLQAAPEWADDAHLDQAFANWTPGPPADAPAAEREMAAHVDPFARRRIDDDLADALTEALTAAPVVGESVYLGATVEFQLEATAPEPLRSWSRGDDDILPVRSRKGPFSRLSR